MDKHQDAVFQLLEAYRAAAFAKDVPAMVSIYATDVVIFDLWDDWSCAGRDAWQSAIAGWLGSLGEERVRVEAEQVRIHVSGELATLHAFLRYQALAVDGSTLRAMRNRLTWVLTRGPTGWQVSHQHTSAPIDSSSLKVIFGS